MYIYMKRGKDCSFAFFFVVKWGNRVEDDSIDRGSELG